MFAKFIIFLFYVFAIFFLPDRWWVVVIYGMVTTLYSFVQRVNYKKILQSLGSILPFVLATFCFNWWLSDLQKAIFVAVKLMLVCNATMTYAQITSIPSLMQKVRKTFDSAKIQEMAMMICMAISIVAISRRDIKEAKLTLKAKGARLSLKTAYLILMSLLVRSLRRVEQFDEALQAKGIRDGD